MGKPFDNFKHGRNWNPKFIFSFRSLKFPLVIKNSHCHSILYWINRHLWRNRDEYPSWALKQSSSNKTKNISDKYIYDIKYDIAINLGGLTVRLINLSKVYINNHETEIKASETELFLLISEKPFSNGLEMIEIKNADKK